MNEMQRFRIDYLALSLNFAFYLTQISENVLETRVILRTSPQCCLLYRSHTLLGNVEMKRPDGTICLGWPVLLPGMWQLTASLPYTSAVSLNEEITWVEIGRTWRPGDRIPTDGPRAQKFVVHSVTHWEWKVMLNSCALGLIKRCSLQ
jgi:hypothetical protein